MYAVSMSDTAQLRIGELARRTGVATELLRAWERRYGLLSPIRTEAGYRLYSAADVSRVRRMRELLAAGLSAKEAAGAALDEPVGGQSTSPDSESAELRQAIERLDDAAVHAAFDRLLAEYSLDSVLEGVVLPLLRELGDGWARGDVSIAQEHFASNVLRGRLLGLARGWDRGAGPRAVLACPPGERHDLGLLIFGLALREHGWRITFLGADTPSDTIVETVRRIAPEALVLSVTDRSRLEVVAEAVAELAGATTVWVGGAGAAEVANARLLDASPLAAAAAVAAAY
jgi:DNA-binding transcriptional MerR regulator/methylmalonyl-CoA mutase cobalamin-binding subunit